ncbi:adenosylcobinamide-GDP ribazoletransferase [uncultured Sphingomonas sp.]|uniref:adenosylcobinamide-GDP ribazoletransferase n=1 Tax=uncultured Sphingomonas sp. TaxID=158754 RepID=UPI0035C9EE65
MTFRPREEAATFAVAVQFLTRLPVPAGAYTPGRLRAAVRYYPLVGILVGGAAALVMLAAAGPFTPLIAILLSCAATLLLTGAFHEDGLADTFDGIGGAGRARALEIMRDSRIGTYGALALSIVLALKVAALAALPPPGVPIALIAGHGLSRLSAVLVIVTSHYARDDGTGKFTADGVPTASLFVALGTGALIAAALAWTIGGAGVLFALAGLAIGHGAARLAFERRLGGYTGDCLGAVQQVSEVGVYLGLLAWV